MHINLISNMPEVVQVIYMTLGTYAPILHDTSISLRIKSFV